MLHSLDIGFPMAVPNITAQEHDLFAYLQVQTRRQWRRPVSTVGGHSWGLGDGSPQRDPVAEPWYFTRS